MSLGLLKYHTAPPVFFTALLLFFGTGCFRTQAASNNFNLESQDYPVVVVSENPEYGGLVLDLLNRSFKHFSTVMGAGSFQPLRFRVLLDKEPPTVTSQEMETLCYPRTVRVGDSTVFEIRIPSRDFNPIALVRTAMICQLEAYAVKNQPEGLENQLPAAPFWLSEGLTQGFLDKRTPSLEKIIARIDRSGPAPTLETVQGWEEISPHRLEQWWQEACCYWLVRKATATGADREALLSWLPTWFAAQAKPYWNKNDETEVWWTKTLGERTHNKSEVTVGENQTREQLRSCLQFKARLKGETLSKDFDLANLPKPPLEFASSRPFDEVMAKLLVLQARGNFLWQDVIESYRFAYTMWLKGKYTDYQKEVAKAEAKAENVAAYMSKTRDYLDWYEVNHPSSGPKFSTLLTESLAFQDAQTLEQREKAGANARLTPVEKGN